MLLSNILNCRKYICFRSILWSRILCYFKSHFEHFSIACPPLKKDNYLKLSMLRSLQTSTNEETGVVFFLNMFYTYALVTHMHPHSIRQEILRDLITASDFQKSLLD